MNQDTPQNEDGCAGELCLSLEGKKEIEVYFKGVNRWISGKMFK